MGQEHHKDEEAVGLHVRAGGAVAARGHLAFYASPCGRGPTRMAVPLLAALAKAGNSVKNCDLDIQSAGGSFLFQALA